MKILLKASSKEITIRGSRFLGEIFFVEDAIKVRSVLKSQKQKYSDATHVCHAFIIGKNAEIMGMSDDGEPGGTAGRPILDLLKGRKLTNVLLTVTRWFGGVLLGTGGLVHAYSDCAKACLDASEFEELIEKSKFSFTADYSIFQSLKKEFENWSLYDFKQEFFENVKAYGMIAKSDSQNFAKSILEKSNGLVIVNII
ncbi:IMPACT family protein [Treponema pectinovorum]|uniref:IMPACT family protein n=1 Tax=Treponema pectinovorum TaxID=164 RepID=UPI003D92C2A5